MQLVATLDEYGKPAWITAMIVGFLLWWPIGLGVLAYLIWSGRMGCGAWKHEWKDSEFGREVMRWRRGMSPLKSTGNRAFDQYREDTLRRLEEEAEEFRPSCSGCGTPRTRPSSTSSWPSVGAPLPRRNIRAVPANEREERQRVGRRGTDCPAPFSWDAASALCARRTANFFGPDMSAAMRLLLSTA